MLARFYMIVLAGLFCMSAGGARADPGDDHLFEPYRPDYYARYYSVAHDEAFPPGHALRDEDYLSMMLHIQNQSKAWADAVKIRLHLEKSGKLKYTYVELRDIEKGDSLLKVSPRAMKQVTYLGTWSLKGYKLSIALTHENGEKLDSIFRAAALWQGNRVLLPSGWGAFPLPGCESLVESAASDGSSSKGK